MAPWTTIVFIHKIFARKANPLPPMRLYSGLEKMMSTLVISIAHQPSDQFVSGSLTGQTDFACKLDTTREELTLPQLFRRRVKLKQFIVTLVLIIYKLLMV